MTTLFLSVFTILLANLALAANSTLIPVIDAKGNTIGQVEWKETTNQTVDLSVTLKGAQPGTKAIHIHEKGICEGPAFTTAGGHYNPTGKAHGKEHPNGKHLGDLPNIEINKSGDAVYKTKISNATLKPNQPNTLAPASGTALVIHANADDHKSQPAGNAGDRMYCAVLIKPSKM
jgi:Cu-Zn family superoxide dismutase